MISVLSTYLLTYIFTAVFPSKPCLTSSPVIFFLLFQKRNFVDNWQRCVTCQMSFPSPNQQYQSTEGKLYISTHTKYIAVIH